MSRPNDAQAVPAAVERFVKQLVITHKAVALYPAASSIPRENAADAVALLDAVLAETSDMRLVVCKNALLFEGMPVFPDRPAFIGFAQELYNRTISEVRFHAGVNIESLVSFLGVLRISVEELRATGGASSRLWDSGVDAITLIEASTMVIDQDEDADTEGPEADDWPPDQLAIDAMLAAAGAGSPRDRRVFVRTVLDSEVASAYLARAFARHSGTPLEAARDINIAGLARAADIDAGERRSEALQSLASAIVGLEPEQRHALVTAALLPESRTDESAAALVRQLGVDAVCRALVEGVNASEVSTDALARALRNLTLISLAGRGEVLDAAGAAMRSAGFEEGAVNSVLEAVAPKRLIVRSDAESSEIGQPAELILELLDAAPSVPGRGDEDPGLSALRDEARAGVTDGDVMGALVTLATLDGGARDFSRAMDDLEEGLELLIDKGEFEVAADAAESLIRAASEAPGERGERFSQAVSRLAGADEMRTVHKALRLYRKGSPEHSACLRLLGALGTLAIDPLLEVLADEPDMSVRKSLVELISTIADRHIEEVGERVTDSRWYVVRNVVSILGATRRADVLPFLGRTVRHSDARVRRETIRAVAGITDALVAPMLVSALDDADGQNVQLAARYLGSLRLPGAIRALERVALGEGRGNRDQGPRIEAIEALGSIGSTEAIPTLTALTARKRRLGHGRNRGLAPAAESALAAIVARSAEEGR